MKPKSKMFLNANRNTHIDTASPFGHRTGSVQMADLQADVSEWSGTCIILLVVVQGFDLI